MTAKFLVDTNILVYAASEAVADQARRELSLELLDQPDLALSAQVLAEFYAVANPCRAILPLVRLGEVRLKAAHKLAVLFFFNFILMCSARGT